MYRRGCPAPITLAGFQLSENHRGKRLFVVGHCAKCRGLAFLAAFFENVSCQGHSAKKRESGVCGTHFLKMQILRFHDLIAKIGIAKIGIAKIGIPILEIHPDRDPDFSDPSRSGSRF
jgi:hypothetical protein